MDVVASCPLLNELIRVQVESGSAELNLALVLICLSSLQTSASHKLYPQGLRTRLQNSCSNCNLSEDDHIREFPCSFTRVRTVLVHGLQAQIYYFSGKQLHRRKQKLPVRIHQALRHPSPIRPTMFPFLSFTGDAYHSNQVCLSKEINRNRYPEFHPQDYCRKHQKPVSPAPASRCPHIKELDGPLTAPGTL